MTRNHPMHLDLYAKEAKIMRVVWEVPNTGMWFISDEAHRVLQGISTRKVGNKI